MESSDLCKWYMLKIGDEFAIQYYGDKPDDVFPQRLGGISVLGFYI
jgi:hypothetical protein